MIFLVVNIKFFEIVNHIKLNPDNRTITLQVVQIDLFWKVFNKHLSQAVLVQLDSLITSTQPIRSLW